MGASFAVTWWGHSCATIELGSTRVGTDPLLTDRVLHLRRYAPTPTELAADVDVVLVSHLHRDHLHVPSLGIVAADAPIVLPRGGTPLVSSLSGRTVVEVEPGDHLELCGVHIEVLPARHDGRRGPMDRRHAPALGFRVHDAIHSFWYPGDTGVDGRMVDVDSVDLAVVPIGGWGPTLGDQHLGPEDAAKAVAQVGARWALPVHFGTFWPVGLRALHRANHHRLFTTPGPRFVEALAQAGESMTAVVAGHGERMVLDE